MRDGRKKMKIEEIINQLIYSLLIQVNISPHQFVNIVKQVIKKFLYYPLQYFQYQHHDLITP